LLIVNDKRFEEHSHLQLTFKAQSSKRKAESFVLSFLIRLVTEVFFAQ
jgi:hypothetical protein